MVSEDCSMIVSYIKVSSKTLSLILASLYEPTSTYKEESNQ